MYVRCKMLKPREKVEESIQRQLRALEGDTSNYRVNISSLIDELNKKHRISFSTASDLLTQKVHISTASDFELFAIMNVVNNKLIPDYFTPIEIKKYSKYKVAETQEGIKKKCSLQTKNYDKIDNNNNNYKINND